MTALDCLVFVAICFIYNGFLNSAVRARRGLPSRPIDFMPAVFMSVLVMLGTIVNPLVGIEFLGLIGMVAAVLAAAASVLLGSTELQVRLFFLGILTALALVLIPVTAVVEFYEAEINVRPVVVRHVTVVGPRCAMIEAPGSVVRECESN